MDKTSHPSETLHAAGDLQQRTEALEARVAELTAAVAAQRAIRAELEKRSASLEQTEAGNTQHLMATDKVLAAREALEAENSALKEALVHFLTKYYPPPATPDAAGYRYPSLLSLVQELLRRYEAAGGSGPERYVATTDAWPLYVELLLRAGVAEKHPSDSSRLRLADLADF